MTRKFLSILLMILGVSSAVCTQNSFAQKSNHSSGRTSCCQLREPGKAVLGADHFFGKVAASYEAAKEIPDTCCKLFCYCGCDQIDGHTSLLDCFASDHTETCPVCQDEVLKALRLKKLGKQIGEIQQSVDREFDKEYPWNEPTA